MATEVLKPRGTSREFLERELDNCLPFLLRSGTELFLRNCNPTPTHVNSKSLIITLAHPDNRATIYLRAPRIPKRGEDVILTKRSSEIRKSETPTPLTYVRQRCRAIVYEESEV